MNILIGSVIRKLIVLICGSWLTLVISWLNTSGVFAEGELNQEKIIAGLTQIILAIVLILGSALWSYIKRRMEAKKIA